MWPTLGPEQMVHFLVKNFPSSCVRMAATGQIVGWTLARPDLGICAVHVAQNHRRHGIGQFMMASVARDLTCQGYLAFCFVSHSSSAALGMLNHLGFELNSDMEAVWAQYRPLDQQQRLAVGQQCLPHWPYIAESQYVWCCLIKFDWLFHEEIAWSWAESNHPYISKDSLFVWVDRSVSACISSMKYHNNVFYF